MSSRSVASNTSAGSVGVLGGVRSGGVSRRRGGRTLFKNAYSKYPILSVALNAECEELHLSNQTQLTALSNSRFLMYVYWENKLRLVYVQRRKRLAVVRLYEVVSTQTDLGPELRAVRTMYKFLVRQWGAPSRKRSSGGDEPHVWKNITIEDLVKLFRLDALETFAGGAPSIFIVGTRVEPKDGPALVSALEADDDGLSKIKITAAVETDQKGEMYRVSPRTGNFLFPDLGVRDKTMPLPEPQTLFNLAVSGNGSIAHADPALQAKAGLLEKVGETADERKKRAEALNRYKLLLNDTFRKQELKMRADDKAAKKAAASTPLLELARSKLLTAYQLKVIALCQKLRPSKSAYVSVFGDDVGSLSGLGLSLARGVPRSAPAPASTYAVTAW